MKQVRGAALAISLIVMTGCGKKEEEESGPKVVPIEAAFLTAADIAEPAVTDTVLQSEMVETLSEADALYNNQPEAAEEASDACFDERFEQIVIRATTSTLSFGAETDVADCLQLNYAGDPDAPTVDSMPMKMFFQVECEGVDFSSYDGKTAKEAEGIEASGECTSAKTIENLSATASLSGNLSVAGISAAFSMTLSLVKFSGNDAMGGCSSTVEGEIVTIGDDCISTGNDRITSLTVDGESETPPSPNYERYAASGIKADGNDTSVWYREGSIAAQVNQWKGSVLYSSATTAPTYTMALGSQTATGTVSATAGLGLTKGAPGHLRARAGAAMRGMRSRLRFQ